MNPTEADKLETLATLIQRRNVLECEITEIIGRPALLGHVGEYIASMIFDIELEGSATTAGYDGRFRNGPLAGQSVNVKMYGKLENLLDINEKYVPDWLLVLTGPKAKATSSKGLTRPWTITEAFLFDAPGLLARLKIRGVKLGVATSVVSGEWESARVFPAWPGAALHLSEEQTRLLELFPELAA